MYYQCTIYMQVFRKITYFGRGKELKEQNEQLSEPGIRKIDETCISAVVEKKLPICVQILRPQDHDNMLVSLPDNMKKTQI